MLLTMTVAVPCLGPAYKHFGCNGYDCLDSNIFLELGYFGSHFIFHVTSSRLCRASMLLGLQFGHFATHKKATLITERKTWRNFDIKLVQRLLQYLHMLTYTSTVACIFSLIICSIKYIDKGHPKYKGWRWRTLQNAGKWNKYCLIVS